MKELSSSSDQNDWKTPTYLHLAALRERGASVDEIAEAAVSNVGRISSAVPIERLALLCGVREVVPAALESMSAVLVPSDGNHGPIIVVNSGEWPRRRRFSIAHELAHLLLGHMDLRRLTDDGEEKQADRLAALLLLPSKEVRAIVGFGRPDVRKIEHIANKFQVSIDAAARAYVLSQPEPTVAIIVRRGIIERSYQDSGTPYVVPRISDLLPLGSGAHDPSLGVGQFRSSMLSDNGVWFDSWRTRSNSFVEQVYRTTHISTLIILHQQDTTLKPVQVIID